MTQFRTLKDFSFRGLDALKEVIAQSEYRTPHQAVAALAVFSNPITVQQTSCKNLFRVIRARGEHKRTSISAVGDIKIMHDDNWSPKRAFAWANQITIKAGKDVQLNHIVSKSDDVGLYTNLANLVALPSFLSKLTDTHPEIRALLNFRSQQLFGPRLADNFDQRPAEYDSLVWADPLPPVTDVQSAIRSRMASCPKDRATLSARNIGWLFSDFLPDGTL